MGVERGLRRMKARLERQKLLGMDVESELEKMERSLEEVRLRLINKAKEIMPWMIKVAEVIGVSESISGLVGLIGVLTYLKASSYHQAVKYLGLYRAKGPSGRKLKRCSGAAREYLIILTASIHTMNGGAWPPRMKDLRQALWMTISAVKTVKAVSPPGEGRAGAAVPSANISSPGGPLQGAWGL